VDDNDNGNDNDVNPPNGNDNDDVDPPDSNDIIVFPKTPTSGELFVVSHTKKINTSGFIWINNKIIPVNLMNGFAVVETDEKLYGKAELWLHPMGFIYTFNIALGVEGNVVLHSKDKTSIGDMLEIRATVGGTDINDLTIYLTNPDGIQFTYKTDSKGKIYPIMDKTGDWVATTSFNNIDTVKKITVTHKSLSVNIDKDSFNEGEIATITTGENNVEFTVKRAGITVFQTTSVDGTLQYTPPTHGSYVVYAVTADKQGSKEFSVRTITNIKIYDSNNMQTSILKQNQNYIVKITDNSNNIIKSYDVIQINSETIDEYEYQFPVYSPISLSDGIGFWIPEMSGRYRLSIPDKDNYVGSTALITIEGTTAVAESMDITIPLAVIIVIVVIIILYYLYHKGLITLPDLQRKGIPDKLL